MNTRRSLYISVIGPIALGACVSQPVVDGDSLPIEPTLVYADADTETVDQIRADASTLELANGSENTGVVCRREAKTGSHVRRTVCRSERQREIVRENSQDWLRSGGIQGGPVIAR